MNYNRYRKKPIEVEAIQFDGWNWATCMQFMSDEILLFPQEFCKKEHLVIHTVDGDMKANIGDYIIKGVNGEFYPCKPDIFEKTYELLEDKPKEQFYLPDKKFFEDPLMDLDSDSYHSYRVDLKWFDEIRCRRPAYGCINFHEFLILDKNDEVVDSIRIYPKSMGDRIVTVDKETYNKIDYYRNNKEYKN